MLFIVVSVQLLISCAHALPVTEEYDYGDNNTSDVDASADNGAHSSFTGQQYGPDGIYDTLTEANTGGNMNLDLYVDSFDNTRTGWTRHGTAPYLDAQNYPTDYVRLGSDRTESIGDFGFQNSSKSSETINSVILRVYAWKEDSQDRLWVYLWDNSSWGNANNVIRTSAGWTEFDVTTRLDTWAEIDSAKIYLNGDTTQAENYWLFADCAMLRITYNIMNYDLDLEVQWTNATYDMPNEELCIFGGTMASENLEVDVWNGSAWQNLFPSLSSGWNNVSVTDYLVSPVFTIRFEGGTKTGDALRDSWQIDSTLLHTWAEEGVRNDVSPILQYVLPIVLGFLSFLVVGIVWKKRGTSPTPLDFDYFNEMAAGGIPDGYSVMIVGSESSGKSILCQQLVHAYLSKEKPCIYVTYDCFPDEVRKNMRSFNWETSLHEQKGLFKFIDCYSPAADVTSEEENFVESPFSLSDLGISMSEVMDRVEHKSTKIFLDSTAPIFTSLEPSTVVEFLQDRSAKAKGNNSNFFYTVGKGTIPPPLMRRLKETVDCIIELGFEEENGITSRKMRIRKLRGRKSVNTWISFGIKPGKGIVFLSPTIHK